MSSEVHKLNETMIFTEAFKENLRFLLNETFKEEINPKED
jgi:hypothetical protein